MQIFKHAKQCPTVSGKLSKTTVVRSNSRYAKNNPITRSSSTGVLNQSDSEYEGMDKKRQSRLFRPTISSQNKITNRKRVSHSTGSKIIIFFNNYYIKNYINCTKSKLLLFQLTYSTLLKMSLPLMKRNENQEG